jgi:predicted O-linked N-acetylglucosamine transferase (SPINDLY family)
LPKEGFVFCSFNNYYKITPKIFDIWMRLLKKVEGSVLWLTGGNITGIKNLQKEANQRGVDSNRLIFARGMPLADHLARHKAADLFIDTLPYNAHVTASDALWSGLPVLTLIGQSFASRVSASLLNAVGLQELITYSEKEYEDLSIELATNPTRLKEIKSKLEKNKLIKPLFNTKLFTKNIETAYTKIYQKYLKNLPVENIEIK